MNLDHIADYESKKDYHLRITIWESPTIEFISCHSPVTQDGILKIAKPIPYLDWCEAEVKAWLPEIKVIRKNRRGEIAVFDQRPADKSEQTA